MGRINDTVRQIERDYYKKQEQKKIADALARQQKQELKLEPSSIAKNQETLMRKKRRRDSREGTLLVSGVQDANLAPSAFGGQKTLLGE